MGYSGSSATYRSVNDKRSQGEGYSRLHQAAALYFVALRLPMLAAIVNLTITEDTMDLVDDDPRWA
jgi:hypothetical protein